MGNPRLENKVVLVVGGTSGLGLSAVQACWHEGASLVVVGRQQAKCQLVEQQFGSRVQTMVGDAVQPDTVERAIHLCRERFGGFHALYHVAGGSGRSHGDGPLDQVSDEGWNYTLRLNLDSLFFSNRAAIRDFLTHQQGGSILNMASVLGWSSAPKYFATHGYATSKAAAIGMTTAAAAFYAAQDIRLNVLAPALVDTPLAARAAANSEIMEYIKTKQPLDGGRIGRPDDADAAVVFLLSDESRFVTGQVIAVDGGWSVSEGQIPLAGRERE